KTLWTQETASFEGEFWSFRDVVLSPPPFQKPHPRVWVGGRGPRSVRRAVGRGDGWHPFSITLEEFRGHVAYARKLLQQECRPTFDFVGPMSSPTVGDLSATLAEVRSFAEAGATHLNIGFHYDSEKDLLRSLEWTSEKVMPHFREGI